MRNFIRNEGIILKSNIEIGDYVRNEDAGKKIGSIFRDTGNEIGRQTDECTKDITFKVPLQ